MHVMSSETRTINMNYGLINFITLMLQILRLILSHINKWYTLNIIICILNCLCAVPQSILGQHSNNLIISNNVVLVSS